MDQSKMAGKQQLTPCWLEKLARPSYFTLRQIQLQDHWPGSEGAVGYEVSLDKVKFSTLNMGTASSLWLF